MVVYTLLKKHAFAVLKYQKNGPSDQSERTQDQSWPQGAHVWGYVQAVVGKKKFPVQIKDVQRRDIKHFHFYW